MLVSYQFICSLSRNGMTGLLWRDAMIVLVDSAKARDKSRCQCECGDDEQRQGASWTAAS